MGASKEEFLKLLVAQLQHQDPLDPQDGSQFVHQLATFAQLESNLSMNTRLEAIAENQGALARIGMSSLVGSTVSGSLEWARFDPSATMPELRFDLAEGAKQVEMKVYDEGGSLVKTVTMGAKPAGAHTVDWDGTNDKGVPLAAGEYRFELTAVTADGRPLGPTLEAKAPVSSLTFADGESLLALGALSIRPTSIRSIAP